MTMSDQDWGTDQWDVDSNAESLNRSLFGKKKKTGISSVKPDLNTGGKSKTDLGQDSGDDDDGNEKLSKKAKKKLKERRRKENVRNKKSAVAEGNDEDAENEIVGRGGKNEKIQISKTSSNKVADKKKEKSKGNKSDPKTKDDKRLNGKRKSLEKKEEKEPVKNKKRKISLAQDRVDNAEGDALVKEVKTAEGDSKLQEKSEPKKKRNRKKKKKPSSKKNKYKHLGLKADRPVVSESDSENELDKGTKKSQNDSAPERNSQVVLENSKKRKKSLSPEKMQVKKIKLVDDSEESHPVVKLKKQKKTLDTSQAVEGLVDGNEKKQKKGKKAKLNSEEESMDKNKSNTKSTTEKVDNESNSKKIKKEKSKNLKKGKVVEEDKEGEEKELQKSTISPFFSSQGMELQQKFVDKLVSGRFRFINEQLYTIKGGEAFHMFQQDKTLMEVYNTGFQSQVRQWSVNPLDIIIKQLSSKPSRLKVVDFGCGEARLSASVPQKVHSFDLYALNERVTVCNMAKTPLESESMDIAVFCLSLMGTNLNDYLLEANRVLKEGGILKIAEVVSRFTDFNLFASAVSSMGFRSVNSRELSKMFYLMDFKKVKSVKKSSKQIKTLSLNPCVYKKR